jgi:putative ABC transport system permease protein
MTMRRLIRVGEPALWALRHYSGWAMLLIGMTIVASAAILSVTTLVHPGSLLHTRLEFSTAGGVASHGMWGRTPAATENAAIANLFDLLLCGMGAVVAVAVVSLASLFAARESQRTVEVVARRAVGASRRLLLGSTLIEACILASSALVLGSGAGVFASRRSIVSWPGNLGDPSVFPSIVGLSALAVILVLCAVLPWLLARNRSATGTSSPVPLALPAFQLGLSLIVLTAAGLLTRETALRLESKPAGSAAGQVFRQLVDDSTPAARASRYGMLLDELDAGKRFDTVSLTATGGLVGLGTVAAVTTDCGQCSEGGIFLPWHVVPATHQFVSADSFHALGVRLLAGRGISRSDRWGATPVAVVSRSLAIRHFQRGEAIGRKILLGDDARTWHTVVGIVSDVPARGLGGSLQPVFAVYASVLQHPVAGVDLLIRPQGTAPIDATSVAAIHRELALAPSTARLTESELAADELRPVQWFAGRIAFVGWATLALGCCGTLSLIWLWVLSLQSELGLRRAVGARRRTVLAFVLVRACGVGFGGVAVALWFGPGVWALLHDVLADFPVWDGGTLLRYALILLFAVLVGALPLAVRATRVSPGRLLA